MTVIVYRDGVLASDSLVSFAGERVGTMTKIFQSPTGEVAAGCGRSSLVQAFGRWVEAGLPDKTFDAAADDEDFGGIVVHPDGRFVIVTADGHEMEIVADWYADGSGASVARGALAMGATAEEAVEVAIRLHTKCGGPVQVARLVASPADMPEAITSAVREDRS